MTEDPFANIESGVGEVKPLSSPPPSKVIKRIYHTRTEMLIYPNGQVYPGKCNGWFEDKIYQHKPKEKKKKIVPKKSGLIGEESY